MYFWVIMCWTCSVVVAYKVLMCIGGLWVFVGGDCVLKICFPEFGGRGFRLWVV